MMSPKPTQIYPTTPASGPRNVILTGFMGTGKSSAGRRLAQRLGWTFVDTDDLIEARAGKTIARIFEEDGEPAFRAIEADVARELATLERHVIATGGGMITKEENLLALEAAGAVVHLMATPETIWERTRSVTHRPLLNVPDPQTRIRQLLEERAEAYGRVGLKVKTDGRDQAAVAQAVAIYAGLDPLSRRTVQVDLGERSYPIQIGAGCLGQLGERLAEHFPPRPCVVVTNTAIGRLWGRAVIEGLKNAGYRVSLCEIPEGEEHKHLRTVERIYDHFLGERHGRQSGVVALGGGVVGDIAGFAAATLLRGVPFIQLPTSLLAMVDSSVGGKTGVNHPMGKNLVGAFWQPAFVGIDPDFLETLPDEELRAGMAEVIKYGIIADAELFEWLESNIERAMAREPEAMARLIERSCQIKADVVARDEREGGLRAILNYGHTFGHAAEALSGYSAIRHGEGVAMGMAAAARLAAGRGLIGEAIARRQEDLLKRAGLPTRMLRFSLGRYWEAMGSDKKVRDGKIRFVLPDRLGHVTVFDDVTRDEVFAALEETLEA